MLLYGMPVWVSYATKRRPTNSSHLQTGITAYAANFVVYCKKDAPTFDHLKAELDKDG